MTGTSPRSGRSFWAAVTDLPADLQAHPLAQESVDYANFVLWSLTGRRYTGRTTVTEAYDTRTALSRGSDYYPVLRQGQFYNVSNCSDCLCSGCGIMHRTRLRGSPVNYVESVWADGQKVPREDYVLLDHSVLGFLGSRTCALQCLTVTYNYGTGAPPGGRGAAVKLAAELLAARSGGKCRLPERVTSVSRQGMSWTLLDPQDFLKDGRTGIYDIDLMLHAANPTGALLPAKVFSPDLPRASTITVPDPPLSVVLSDGDQVVVPGSPVRWVLEEPAVVAALAAGSVLETRFSTGGSAAGRWTLLDGAEHVAVLDLSPAETAPMHQDAQYDVIDVATGSVVLCADVRSVLAVH